VSEGLETCIRMALIRVVALALLYGGNPLLWVYDYSLAICNVCRVGPMICERGFEEKTTTGVFFLSLLGRVASVAKFLCFLSFGVCMWVGVVASGSGVCGGEENKRIFLIPCHSSFFGSHRGGVSSGRKQVE